MECLNCGRDWPTDSEQGVAISLYKACIVCIVCIVKKRIDWDSKRVMRLAHDILFDPA